MKKLFVVTVLLALIITGATSAFADNWVLMGSSPLIGGRAEFTGTDDAWSVDFNKTFNFTTAPYMGGAYGPNHIFQYTADQFDLILNTSTPVALSDRNADGTYSATGTGQWGIVDKTKINGIPYNSPIWGGPSDSVDITNFGAITNLKSDGLIHWASLDHTTPFATDYQLRLETLGTGFNYNLYADVPSSVPEPSSIIALLGGVGSLLAFRRRKA